MSLAELLKALVECEDQMERMALVEANQELLSPTAVEGEGELEGEESTGSTEDWEAKYNELKQKYIDTFFGGVTKEEGNEDSSDDEKDEETKRAESITIDDLTKGDKE
jgi:hypothetical protein